MEAENVPTTPLQFEAKPGRAWYRFWAEVIDSYIAGIPLAAFLILFIYLTGGSTQEIGSENSSTITLFGYGIGITLYISYFVYFIYKKGATIGKDAYGLTVVSLKPSKKLTLGQVILRECMVILIPLVPFIGPIFYLTTGFMIILRKDKKGIQDLAANTQVMHTRPAWKMTKQFGCLGIFILGFIILLAIMASLGYFVK